MTVSKSLRRKGRAADETADAPRSSLMIPASLVRSRAGQIALDWQRERSDLDLDEFLLSMLMIHLGDALERRFEALCQELYGISGSDMRVLFALRRSGRPFMKRPTDLFTALAITSGAITKKADRLTGLEFVARRPDPAHAGGFLIQLTSKGVRAADEVVELLCRQPMLKSPQGRLSKAEVEEGLRFALRALEMLEFGGGGSAAPVSIRRNSMARRRQGTSPKHTAGQKWRI